MIECDRGSDAESASADVAGCADGEPVVRVAGDDCARTRGDEGPLGVLLRLASAARLYRSGDGSIHARVRVGMRQEVHGIRSAGFRGWLISGYYADRGEPPAPWVVSRVVGFLEAKARFDAETPAVCVRVAPGTDVNETCYILDLGDSSGAAIEISGRGWELRERPDIQFRRPAGMMALPMPRRGGSIEMLRPYLNVDDAGLGSVLDAVANGLRELPAVKLERMQRMADFARWGVAVGRGLGWKPDAFLSAYKKNRITATESSLEGSPLGNFMLKFAARRFEFERSPAELLAMFTNDVGRKVAKSAGWPKTAQLFTRELRRIAPQLRLRGVSVVIRRTHQGRRVRIVAKGKRAGSENVRVVVPPSQRTI